MNEVSCLGVLDKIGTFKIDFIIPRGHFFSQHRTRQYIHQTAMQQHTVKKTHITKQQLQNHTQVLTIKHINFVT